MNSDPAGQPPAIAAKSRESVGPRRRVAIYGGSFNPPHVGHVLTAVWALSIGAVDEICCIPVYAHAFDKALVDFEHRLAMTELAMSLLPGVFVSRVEAELGGASRTLHTLQHLAAQHPEWDMRLLLGADILGETDKWHAFDQVKALAPLLVVGRLGFTQADVPPPQLPEVSSTYVRSTIAAHKAADLDRVVPARVLAYIEAHGLYRSPSDGDGDRPHAG